MQSHEDMYERPLVDCLAEDVSCALGTQKPEVDGLKPSMFWWVTKRSTVSMLLAEISRLMLGKILDRSLNLNLENKNKSEK